MSSINIRTQRCCPRRHRRVPSTTFIHSKHTVYTCVQRTCVHACGCINSHVIVCAVCGGISSEHTQLTIHNLYNIVRWRGNFIVAHVPQIRPFRTLLHCVKRIFQFSVHGDLDLRSNGWAIASAVAAAAAATDPLVLTYRTHTYIGMLSKDRGGSHWPVSAGGCCQSPILFVGGLSTCVDA